MAGPHRRVSAVCSVEVCKDLGQVLHRDKALAGSDSAACPFFRELAGRTVDPMLFK